MFLLSLTATCQVCTVSLKAGLSTYNRLARGTLDAPDGEAAQAKPGIMGVAGQTAAAATGGLVGQLETDREDKGEDELNEGRAVADQLKVIALVVKIDGDSAVFSRR